MEDPEPITDGQEKNVWWCINGGADIMVTKMIQHLAQSPLYNHCVTSIKLDTHPTNANNPMTVTTKRSDTLIQEQRHYSHVITTTTAACLQTMDLREAGLKYAHREAIRVLRYKFAIKVGIKFKNRWWAKLGIRNGGIGKTDRPTRAVIYPSYALGTSEDDTGVLLACYNWSQDAARLGGLWQGSDGTKQDAIVSAVIADLANMHDMPESDLSSLVVSYHVHDWYRDEFTRGAYGFFGPGQYSSLFGQIQRPAADGRLFIAGEVTSIYHGWVVGSLNSAFRAVHQMLLAEWERTGDDEARKDYIKVLLCRLEDKWGLSKLVPEPEYDTNPKGMAGWQVFLGMLKEDV
jgi:monoamine oxidase